MNELEWHRALRELQQPLAPRHDLWPAIAAALEQPAAAPAQRRPWLLAAVLAGAFALAGGIGAGLHYRAAPGAGNVAAVAATANDPRLRGAFIELDATRDMLHDALRESPGSSLLQRLLVRTERQQSQLRHLAHEAG